MDDNDDDTFYDDDFPDIPDDEFRQLEQNAITFTQREQTTVAVRKQTSHRNVNSSSTQTAEVPVQYRRPPARLPVSLNVLPQQRGKFQNTSTESFDSTILDEDDLPLVVEEISRGPPQRQLDETTAREQWRKDRFAQPNPQSSQRVRQPHRPPGQVNVQTSLQPQAYSGVVRQVAQPRRETATIVTPALYEEDTLRRKIEELEASLQQANEEIITRRGEIATIRAKQDEASRKHQRELSIIKKGKQEETEKHKVAINSLIAEKEVTVDKIRLLNHELDEETRRVQSLQKQLKERPLKDKPSNVNTTPKRNANSLRDGFDDEDLMVISPVKSGRRSKPGTPTANRKRKLTAGNDLNVHPLVLRPSGSGPVSRDEPVSEPPTTSVTGQIITKKDHETGRHLRFIQQVLAFRPNGSQEVLVEQLARYSFPSDSAKTLSSIVLLATAGLTGSRLPGDLLQVFIGLWSRALAEKYYACLRILIEVISYIIDIDTFIIDSVVVTNILPVIQSTAEVNAGARFHLLVKKEWLDNPERKKPEINASINTTSCLELLHTIACLISDESALIELFWRLTRTDFVLMMLNACQPITDVTIVLQLLATSILPTTFGNICPAEQQARMETYITDRVCYLLWEQPKILETEPCYPRAAICNLRLEALNLLGRLTMTSSPNPADPSLALNHGTIFLANHVTAIARLVRSIYDEVDAMYLMTPTQPLHARLVNTAVQILHFLLSSPAGREVDLQFSLSRINGCAHKYRVVLTRLAFREGVFIDRGITDETVRMATELVDDGVTPDEAEDLMAAFGGSQVRVGRSTQG